MKEKEKESRQKPIPASTQARLTKFFISNLPDRCCGADVAKAIRGTGDIFDIYIARKRNKAGERFGFVTLLDVKDSSELVRNLSKISMGDYRLKCNVARFVLEEGEIRQPVSPIVKKKPKSQGNAGVEPFVRMENGYDFMSYKEAFSGASKGKLVKVDSETNAFVDLHGKAIVVRLTSLYVLQRIKGLLKEMKLQEGVVRVLGGLQVLIEFKSKEHAEMALNEIIGRPDLFYKPEIWVGQSTHFERIAWLKILGVPLCILENKVVNDVGSLFGEVVKSARVERAGMDASFQSIGVLLKHGNRIQDEVFLSWKGRTFKVWVMEDHNDWLDDFVFEPGKEENGVSKQRNVEETVDKSPEKQPVFPSAPETVNKDLSREDINGATFEKVGSVIREGISNVSVIREGGSNIVLEKSNSVLMEETFQEPVQNPEVVESRPTLSQQNNNNEKEPIVGSAKTQENVIPSSGPIVVSGSQDMGSGEQPSSGESATKGNRKNQQKLDPIFCFGSREKMEQIINEAINGQNHSLGSLENLDLRGVTIRKKWSRRTRNSGQQDQASAENGGVNNNSRSEGDKVGR